MLFALPGAGEFAPELGGVFNCAPDLTASRKGIGLALREAGHRSWSSTLTKFDGNFPMIRGSRFSRPVHHDPSPAFRHSM